MERNKTTTGDPSARDAFIRSVELYGAVVTARSAETAKICLQNETGSGEVSLYGLFDGIALARNDMHLRSFPFSDPDGCGLIEISHCIAGCYQCSIDGQRVSVSRGDLCLNSFSVTPEDSHCPTSRYSGLSLYIDPESLRRTLGELLCDIGVDLQVIDNLARGEPCFIFRASPDAEAILASLYAACEARSAPRMRLRTLELLLFLSETGAERENAESAELSLMRELRDYIVSDIRRHHTIAELSRLFGLSATVLKESFRRAYGSPPYAYLRARRLELARALLDCGASVAEAADSAGWQNPNKFSEAFRTAYGMTPSQYKKRPNG